MPNYLTPGVYIEEVSTGARPIEAVGTSTVGFIGVAPDVKSRAYEAVAVVNWQQFLKEFALNATKTTALAQAVRGFFDNGGGKCFIVNIGTEKNISGKGLRPLEEIDEIAIVAAPGFTDAASYDALLTHCEKLGDRVAILDAPEKVDTLTSLVNVATAKPGRGGTDAEASTDTKALRARQSDGGFGAFYFPWIVVSDVFDSSNTITAAPSGHIAGIYARSDAQRGVHKAPANESVRGALDLTYRVTRDEQGDLNTNGVNVIRMFPRDGIRVWGGRTLAASASEWRYINVRRLFNMIEESIAESTRWVVFEPNNETLWQSIRRDVGAFLNRLWSQGALKGKTPEEAFFVKCDAETNPPEVIDSGTVVTVIGIAPVKPAEFVVFRLGQSAAGPEVEKA